MSKPQKITIDDVEYVRADSISQYEIDDEAVCIRTYSAGVFCGILGQREGREVTLHNAIRIWRWAGAASLSQLAMEGVKKPSECKFGVPLPEIVLTEAIEVIAMTPEAWANIKGVPSWKG